MDNTKYKELLNRMICLQEISESRYDESHLEADSLLCEALIELGYAELVEAWQDVGKWYW